MIRLLILMLFVGASSQAGTHRDVRLDAEGFSMEHVAVRDQEQIGDCYAHAAAQMYDAWRFKLGEKSYVRQSSGVELNQRFKIYRGDVEIDGGKLAAVVPQLSKIGTCAESDLNALFNGVTVDRYVTDVMQIYNDEAAAFHAEVDPIIKELPQPMMPVQILLRDRMEQQIKAEHLPKFLAEGTQKLKDLHRRELLMKYDDNRLKMLLPDDDKLKDVVGIFNTLWPITCPRDKARMYSPVPLRVENKSHYGWTWTGYEFRPQESLARIHAELDYHQDAMPIGISYCSAVFKAGRAYKTLKPSSDACGRHASLIIGRQINPLTHRPQLLIRNTWGKYCGTSYSSDWSCEAEKGSIWVDEDILGKAIFETQVFVR